MLRTIRADLHIHSCLSPCGEEEMRPCAIINQALIMGLDMIAICDHNSAENIAAFMSAGSKKGLTVLPGIEVTSKEEIHLLALFDRREDCMALQDLIYQNLPGENVEEVFGCQTMVNEKDETIGINRKMLIGATLLPLEPEGISLDGLEISPRISKEEAQKRFHSYQRFSFVRFSDAHRLQDIGKSITYFLLKETSLEEIKMALHRQEGRRVLEQ